MAGGNVAADLMVHVGSDVSQATAGLDKVNNKVTGMGSGMQMASLAFIGAGAGVIGSVGVMVNAAGNFEQAMANIQAVTGVTGTEFEGLSELALQIGADTSFGATEGAMAIEELAKAGIPVSDIMNGAAMSTALLAEAGGVAMPEAATTMANAMNMFGIAGSEASAVADYFANAANKSSADVSDLSQALAQGGSSAAAYGISLDQTVGALALFSDYGIKGSDAGTSLKTMLASLTPTTQEAADALAATGFSIEEFTNAADPMAYLAGTLETGMKDLSVAERQAALETIFGSDAQRVANILYQEGADGVSDMNAAVLEQGTAAKMAATRMDTLKGAIEQIKGAIETAMIIMGSAFIPVLRGMADGLNGLLDRFTEMNPNVQKFIGITIAAVGGLLLFAGLLAGAAGFFAPMIAATTAIMGPMIALIAIGAALYLAWNSNFLGIRDTVMSAVTPILGVLGQLGSVVKSVFSGDMAGARDAISGLAAPLRPLGILLLEVSTAFKYFYDTLSAKGISEALSTLPGIMDSLGGSFTRFGQAVWDGIGNLDWGAIGASLMDGIGAIGNLLARGFRASLKPLGKAAKWIVDILGDAAEAVGEWAAETFEEIEWQELAMDSLEVLGEIGQWIISALGPVASTIAGWARSAFGAVDWAGAIRAGFSGLASIGADLISYLINVAPELDAWWRSTLDGINFEGFGEKLGETVRNGFLTLAGLIGEYWQPVLTGLIALIIAIPAAIGYLGATLAPKALELLQGFYNGLNINWATVGAWFAGLGDKIMSAIGSASDWLLAKVQEMADGFYAGVDAAWAGVQAWFGGVKDKIVTAIGVATTWLDTTASEIWSGFLTAIGTAWTAVATWFTGLPARITSNIGSALTWLATIGSEIITGLKTAIDTAWVTVSAWFTSMGTLITTAIGTASTWLITKGNDIILGLKAGIDLAWITVSAWFLGLPALVLGAVPSLLTALKTRGEEALKGLKNGMDTIWTTVDTWLGTLTTLIFNAVGSLTNTLKARGQEAFTGLWNGALDIWKSVSTWLGTVTTLIFNAVGSLASTLKGRGSEAFSGLWQGMLNLWASVSGWLSGLGGLITGAIPDLSGVLTGIGSSIMGGLRSGLEAGWNEITSWLGTLNPANYKGPEKRDRQFLVEPGQWIMEGLQEGLTAGWEDTTRLLSSMVPQIPTAEMAVDPWLDPRALAATQKAMAPEFGEIQGATVTQYIQVDVRVDELEDMVQAGEFVRTLNPTRKLYMNGGVK